MNIARPEMSEKTLFPAPPSIDEWEGLMITDTHWKPGRSAMSVALSWLGANGVPPEVVRLLGNDVGLIGMRPEYKVPMGRGGGSGGSPTCDVFAHVNMGGRSCALVIEAKVDEPFGCELSEWRIGDVDNPRSAPNREVRLRKICEVLGLDFPPGDSLRYQLFSQTFAAVRMAERLGADMAAMIVQSFCDSDSGHDDFLAFCEQFAVQPAVDSASEVVLPNGVPLLLGWVRCPVPKR